MPHPQTKPKKARRSPSYESIGQFYDELWECPRTWTAARRRLLELVLPQARQVCELGCGTGVTAIEFARRGLRVFARDLSREMCRITREKARAEGLDVRVSRADVRTFRLPVQVDLVTSEWGVINHLPHRADLARTFRAVARALRAGGYFYFDLHQRKVYEELWPQIHIAQGVIAGQGREFFAAQRGGYDRSGDKGWTEITIFVHRAGRLWERHRERIEEIHWPHGEIVRDLGRAGLQLLRVFDFTDVSSAPSPKKVPGGLRTMYLARKKGA
ncbi:MAG: class I SAM-dependent methyltransferase [Terriglobia bacterium]